MIKGQICKRTVVSLALTLLSSLCSIAQEKSVPAIANERVAHGQPEEIKVHGHWTIVIRNADGSVASRHEFENAMVPNGGGFVILNQLLAHQANTPVWMVWLSFSGGGNNVRLLTPGADGSNPIMYKLNVSSPSSGANAGKLVLEGSVPSTIKQNGQTVSINGQLTEVSTGLNASCNSGVVPCGSTSSGNGFTDRDLTKAVPPDTNPPPPITIQAGQTLDVSVVIGFK